MLILALETSTEAGSCALFLDGEIRQLHCPAGPSHSETLLPLVRQLMCEANVAFSQLDAIAFGAGPGAFTGLRVACGAAQGLAVARDLPLIAVSSLETMAAMAAQPKVLALLDARMGEIYAGAYVTRGEDYFLQGEIRLASPAGLAMPEGAGWLACGNAVSAYPVLAGRLEQAGITCLPGRLLPEAGALARIAVSRLARGETIDPALAAPLYVRDKVAKTVAERLQEGGKA